VTDKVYAFDGSGRIEAVIPEERGGTGRSFMRS
jgi:hypothetical protein